MQKDDRKTEHTNIAASMDITETMAIHLDIRRNKLCIKQLIETNLHPDIDAREMCIRDLFSPG